VVPIALQRAAELAALPGRAYAENKRRLRGALAADALDGLAADSASMLSFIQDPA
jgi:hypothetical protein